LTYFFISYILVRKTMRIPSVLLVLCMGAGAFSWGCMSAASDPPPRRSIHVRGTVRSLTGLVLTVATAAGEVPVQLVPPSRVSVVVASDRGHLKDGCYMGITLVKQPDGSLRALEVHIFPLGVRRSGLGSYAWDLSSLDAAGTTMTNGTTSHGSARSLRLVSGALGDLGGDGQPFTNVRGKGQGGTSMTLQFKSAAMARPEPLTIPWGVPIVTFAEGRTVDLKPGAHVLVIATRTPDGELFVDRVLVGKNGLVPAL
jgi:hypothetical protein